jgi:predicted membrane channel-forming protein YqfA (hemolysin III family)
MDKKISSMLLLLVLSITDAYLLAHPNLIGRLGVLLYKHSYIRNFPRALLTVLLIVAVSLIFCEIIFRMAKRKSALMVYLALFFISVGWLAYVLFIPNHGKGIYLRGPSPACHSDGAFWKVLC